MSLRRSARVASSSTSTIPDAKPSKSASRYQKVTKAAPATKKRKTATPTVSPAQPAPDESQNHHTSDNETITFAIPSLPATPLPKRRKAASESPSKPPPFTPTPSAVGILAFPSVDNDFDSLASLNPRPAEPHATNAALATPGGSRVVAYHSLPTKPEDASPAKKRKAKEVLPPDVGVIPAASTDTARLLKDAEEFLVKVDPKLEELVGSHHCKVFSPEGLAEVVDPFTALSSGIIGQQVSFWVSWTRTCSVDRRL